MLVAFNGSVRRNPKADIAREKDAVNETLQRIRKEPRTWPWRKEGSKARRPRQRPDHEAVLEPEYEIHPRKNEGKRRNKNRKTRANPDDFSTASQRNAREMNEISRRTRQEFDKVAQL